MICIKEKEIEVFQKIKKKRRTIKMMMKKMKKNNGRDLQTKQN